MKFQIIWNFPIFLANYSKYFGIFPTFLEMITNILEFFQLYWKRFVIYSKLFGNGSNFFGIDSEYFRIFTTFLELIPNCLEMIVISNDMKWCKMTWLNRFDIFWLDCEWFQIIWIPKWLEELKVTWWRLTKLILWPRDKMISWSKSVFSLSEI